MVSHCLPAGDRHGLRSDAILCLVQVSLDALDGIAIKPDAAGRFVQTSSNSSQKAAHAVAISISLSPALLIIDHVHFQYNGFLYGLLILSMVLLRHQSTMYIGGGVFAALLCFKHIYLYLAPAYFVYLLRAYCLSSKSIFRVRFGNCLKLVSTLAAVFGAAFGPFWYLGQLDQLLFRLFPFSRGLCHAYWAPNIWSMYSFTDRVLLLGSSFRLHVRAFIDAGTGSSFIGLATDENAVKSATRGLVGDSATAVLPTISPRTTFILTIAFQIVSRSCPCG